MTVRAAEDRAEALRVLEHEVTVLFRRIKRVLVERAVAVHPELSAPALPMLIRIAEGGPVRASALVEEFQMDKGAVSRQIQHLEELGLVVRSPDPDDGRATLLAVTPDAARRLQEVDRARKVRLKDRLADWSADELTAFTDQLARYNRSLS